MMESTFHSSFCVCQTWKIRAVGEEHHLVVAKISKANVFKTIDLISINLFLV